MKWLSLFLIAILVIIITEFFILFVQKIPTSKIATPNNASINKNTKTMVSKAHTYINNEFKYKINYPDNWEIKSIPNPLHSVQSLQIIQDQDKKKTAIIQLEIHTGTSKEIMSKLSQQNRGSVKSIAMKQLSNNYTLVILVFETPNTSIELLKYLAQNIEVIP